ncbi:MAG: tRNA (adenosine(37)-N6)-threonylcarbamoyltransferase complex dimerization subunit type 1 TsaB [Gammaproteobacteria bacterium]|nr:tRNA (adenosine(37)-N6)-threonylcarbamoyltransferase complex dimerization subunit type 1 TsaB [Gammaproteobacteria bacterium]
MKILAIETATEACSAALMLDGESLQKFEFAPRQHAELILPMIDQLLAEAGVTLSQLDAFAYGRGPGSFIGVRIAASVTQGIAYGADLPVVAISSLAALAQGGRGEHILAAIDARMGEIYWGEYTRPPGVDKVVLQGREQLIAPSRVVVNGETNCVGIGSGWQTYGEELSELLPNVNGFDGQVLPQAKSVAELAVVGYNKGQILAASQAVPVYLRDRVAVKPSPT